MIYRSDLLQCILSLYFVPDFMNYILLSVLVLGLANLDPATSGSNLFAKSALINAQLPAKKTDTGLPASNCVKDDLPCELDLSAFQVISSFFILRICNAYKTMLYLSRCLSKHHYGADRGDPM